VTEQKFGVVNMKFFTVLLISALAVCAVFADYAEEDDVLVLTTGDFDKAVEEFKLLLVEFCKLGKLP
jgi:hypothetical protein